VVVVARAVIVGEFMNVVAVVEAVVILGHGTFGVGVEEVTAREGVQGG
jgi:hypothetical protein